MCGGCSQAGRRVLLSGLSHAAAPTFLPGRDQLCPGRQPAMSMSPVPSLVVSVSPWCPHPNDIPTCPLPYAVPIPMASTSLEFHHPFGVSNLVAAPPSQCPHPRGISTPFGGAGLSSGLWGIPVHPTVSRGCVTWLQLRGLLQVMGQDGQEKGS